MPTYEVKVAFTIKTFEPVLENEMINLINSAVWEIDKFRNIEMWDFNTDCDREVIIKDQADINFEKSLKQIE